LKLKLETLPFPLKPQRLIQTQGPIVVHIDAQAQAQARALAVLQDGRDQQATGPLSTELWKNVEVSQIGIGARGREQAEAHQAVTLDHIEVFAQQQQLQCKPTQGGILLMFADKIGLEMRQVGRIGEANPGGGQGISVEITKGCGIR